MRILKIIFPYFLIIVASMIFFYPFLSGSIFADTDYTLIEYPNHILQNQHFIRTSNWFYLWTSSILGGTFSPPVMIGLNYNFLFFIFNKILGPVNTHNFLSYLYLIIAAFLAYLFAKNLKFTTTASLIIVFSLIFFPFNLWRYFFPVIIFLFLFKISQRKYYFTIIAGIVMGWAWYMTLITAQLILYTFFSGFLYALFLDYREYQFKIKQWRVTLNLIFIIFISLLIGKEILLSSAFLNQFTARSAGFNFIQASEGAINLQSLASYFSPYLYFPPPLSSGGGLMLYIGFLPLIFALVGMIYVKNNSHKSFFTFLFLFCLLAGFKYSPLFWIMSKLPGFKYFHAPSRWMFVGIFAFAILVGYGYEFIVNNKEKIYKFIEWLKKIVYSFMAIVVVGNIIFWIFRNKIIIFLKYYFDQNFYQKTTKLPINYYHELIEKSVWDTFNNINLLNYKFFAPFIFIILGYLLLKFYLEGKISVKKFKYLALISIIVNSIIVFKVYFEFMPKKLYLEKPQTASFILQRENDVFSFRIFSFLPGFSEYQKLAAPYDLSLKDKFPFLAEMLTPNLNVIYGLQSFDGYDPFMPSRNAKILAEIGSDRSTAQENKLSSKKNSLEDKMEEFLSKLNLLNMSNIKYIISAYEFPNSSLRKVFEAKATEYEIPIYVYENPDFLPRIYFSSDVEFVNSDEITNKLLDPTTDFNKLSFIECSSCSSLPLEKKEKNNFKIEKYDEGILKLKTNREEDGWLIFSETNLPGWLATIDNQPVQIYKANYLFQAIQVPKGEHKVEFKYDSPTKNLRFFTFLNLIK